MWLEGSISPIIDKFNDLQGPWSLFVTITGDIYVAVCDGMRVDKLTLGATQSTPVILQFHLYQ